MPRRRSEWLHWFRVDCDLVDHPRLHALAKELRIDSERALGRIVRFMGWVARHAPRGVLPASWEQGVSGALGGAFPAALRRVGWVENTPDGDIVRRWWELNGHLLKERERKRRGDSAESARNFLPKSHPTRAEAAAASASESSAISDSAAVIQTPVQGAGEGAAEPHAAQDAEPTAWLTQADIATVQREFPTQDVVLTARKLREQHAGKRFTLPGVMVLRSWVKSAQRMGTERITPSSSSSPRSTHTHHTLMKLEQDEEAAQHAREQDPDAAARALHEVSSLLDARESHDASPR